METPTTTTVGSRGTVVIPAEMRRRYGLEEGSTVIAEPREEGLLLRPAAVLPLESYGPERTAEFLLNNATDEADYERAAEAVRELGLDPETIPHERPKTA